MDALVHIADLLIQTFFYLYILAFLLRLLLQLSRADFYNPISQSLVKITQPILKPARRVIPSIGRLDTASIVVVLLLQLIATSLLLLIRQYMPNLVQILPWAIVGTINLVINIYFVAIIAVVIISWVAPSSYNPVIILLQQLTEPVIAPFRKIIPPMGGLDISVIFVFLTIKVLQIILTNIAGVIPYVPLDYIIGI